MYLAPATNFYKIVIAGESNNVEVWGADPPAAGGKQRFGSGAPDAEATFTVFFPKNSHI